jgi:hypothetical protein
MLSDDQVAEPLSSGLLTSPADGLLRKAIAGALELSPADRAEFLEKRLSDIEKFMSDHPQERPWTFSKFVGTDGSHIFRGGVGHSLVVDPGGVIWRARSYEDFETMYTITQTDCSIASLTPLYGEMRRCSVEQFDATPGV